MNKYSLGLLHRCKVKCISLYRLYCMHYITEFILAYLVEYFRSKYPSLYRGVSTSYRYWILENFYSKLLRRIGVRVRIEKALDLIQSTICPPTHGTARIISEHVPSNLRNASWNMTKKCSYFIAGKWKI